MRVKFCSLNKHCVITLLHSSEVCVVVHDSSCLPAHVATLYGPSALSPRKYDSLYFLLEPNQLVLTGYVLAMHNAFSSLQDKHS